ncbi:MAG: S-adenosylmethionine:tRNA ribosyltransferase-isomerase, partial [Patescibacteria group bacterium]|nr:S-adenosylmethionine:tRNA ribosyltransferase-isomerase [Patescibacteria group bacterium]
IFIKPPFDFKAVDILITNFHLPGSSLMMLVQAFLEYKGSPKRLAELYEIAIAERFRFYSFGDAMLIL